jgi:membrane protease YdiL (CAAX protease family)
MWPKRISPTSSCTAATPRSRRRELIELAGIFSLILVVIWTPRPLQWYLWCVAAVTIVAVIATSFDGLETMGICSANLFRSMWGVALALGVAVVAVALAGYMHTLHLPSSPTLFVRHYGAYAIWATVQQIILQCFFLSRSLRLLPNATAAAAVAAGLFAIAHLPNPVLTVITLICGLASCLFFVRYRNLWPLAVAHAILGISIAVTIPSQIDHNMRVGLSYLTYVDRTALSQDAASAKP